MAPKPKSDNLLPSQHKFRPGSKLTAADQNFIARQEQAQKEAVAISISVNNRIIEPYTTNIRNITKYLTEENMKAYGISYDPRDLSKGTWTPMMIDWIATLAARKEAVEAVKASIH
jgi:hypothetical protein